MVSCSGKRHIYAHMTHSLRIISVSVVKIIRNVFTVPDVE